MPLVSRKARRIYNKKNRRRWRRNKRCAHCGEKLVDLTLKNCEKCRNSHRAWSAGWKLKAMQKISGKKIPQCIACDIVDMRLLNINHIHGQGNKERKQREHGHYSFYKAIATGARTSDDLDLRCWNHNILYEYETGRRKAAA